MTLGLPPPKLSDRPTSYVVRPGAKLVRFYNPEDGDWSRQRSYGPLSDMRFDHHVAPPGAHADRSVWYASSTLIGGVAESWGRLGFIDRESNRRVAVVRARKRLSVLDLVGVAARSVGLTQEIASSTDYEKCQAWARSFYEQYPRLVGIRWRGRQAGSISYVLNDRLPGGALELREDYDVRDRKVWPRVARAALRCRLKIV